MLAVLAYSVLSAEENPSFSPLRLISSLLGRKVFADPPRRELGCNILELLHKLTLKKHQDGQKMQIPCYFPCSQGIRPRSPYEASAFGKVGIVLPTAPPCSAQNFGRTKYPFFH